jgi:uncharacterized protein
MMRPKILNDAVSLADKVGHVLVTTADAAGLPHVGAAGRMSSGGAGKVEVMEWFCPGTLANLDRNRRVAVVVWDAPADHGYQLLGEVEQVEDMAMMDGYTPAEAHGHPIPQVERKLIIRVDRILDFTKTPHSDIAE